jgi:hypothetical protein
MYCSLSSVKDSEDGNNKSTIHIFVEIPIRKQMKLEMGDIIHGD